MRKTKNSNAEIINTAFTYAKSLSHWNSPIVTLHYDVSHGLQSNEFNLGAHFASPSGELFFGGVGGWVAENSNFSL